ncbi:MAG: hypothetical protein GY758_01960 [Fuerstiella sp.]|nr:hypothetical protein [Fuerstiella sp.]MCP4511643.1 hypothetical protein [Fuerstiella sp.]
MISNGSDTLFERIGGAESVGEMVQPFYVRVPADPRLRPFLKIRHLKNRSVCSRSSSLPHWTTRRERVILTSLRFTRGWASAGSTSYCL